MNMKIQKLSKLNNAFSYSFFDWDKINKINFLDKDGNPKTRDGSFVKNNIFFAENGNGKSKLVNVFKSLNENKNNIEKHRDRGADAQEIKVILDDNSEIDFSTSWSVDSLKDKFIFFDQHFIDGFVHSTGPVHTDTPQRRQQRGRNIVYLGNFAKYNSEIDRINALKDEILEKNRIFSETESSKITGLLSIGNITNQTLLSKRSEIEVLEKDGLQTKKDELLKQETGLEKLVQALKDKTKISALNYLLESKDKFSLKIKTVENGAEKEVDLNPSELFSFTVSKGVQQTLHKIAHKKDFIKQGLETITDATTQCPFCEQKIKEDDYLQIIKDYQEIFDETFSREEKNIKILLSKYKAILENLRDLQLPSQNQNFLDEVKKFITLDEVLPVLSLSEEQKAIIKAEIVLVSNKESKILEKVEGSNIDKIKTIITEATALVDSYNKIVQRINLKVKQLKDDANNGNLETKKSEAEKAIKTLKDDIFYIDNKEIFVNYFKAIDQEKKNKEVVDSLEKIYQVMKTKIVEEFNTFIKDYFSVIKDFVKEISPSMEILEVAGEGSYNRNNREPALCGFRIEYNGQDCSNSLSEGEKQVIALAFFFAHIKKETNKNKIIILDDPITSFDTGKRKSTAELIQRETKDFDQLFVFTCDPLFREYCLKQITDRNFYYIFKTKGSSSIHYVPKNKETIFASFETDFRDIENSEGSNENVVIFGQKLRFCLETKIKEDYFGYSEDKLSSMIEQVAGKGKEKFEKLIDNKDVILQIYSYCNTGGLAHYPRDGATSWNELKDKVNQYLSLAL